MSGNNNNIFAGCLSGGLRRLGVLLGISPPAPKGERPNLTEKFLPFFKGFSSFLRTVPCYRGRLIQNNDENTINLLEYAPL